MCLQRLNAKRNEEKTNFQIDEFNEIFHELFDREIKLLMTYERQI